MDMRVIHNPTTSLQEFAFTRKMDPMSGLFYGELRQREDAFSTADVSPKHFVSTLNNKTSTAKDFDSQQNGHRERANGINNPEYTSLTDVYERALRNVLDIKLNLKCEDKSCISKETLDDGPYLDKISSAIPGRHTMRYKNESGQRRVFELGKHKDDQVHRGPSVRAPKLLRRSGSANEHSSAFHVPQKRHHPNESSPEYSRSLETRFNNQFGMVPGYPKLNPDFPSQRGGGYRFGPPPSSYGDASRNQNAIAQSLHGLHRMQHAAMTEQRLRWRSQAGELPPLFPLNCTIERESFYEKDVNANRIEKVTNPYSSRFFPGHRFVKNENAVLEKYNGCSNRTTYHNYSKDTDQNSLSTPSFKELEEKQKSFERENLASSTQRHKPYGFRYKPNCDSLNSFSETTKGTKSKIALHGTKFKKCEEFGEKEKFLYKLGLARTNTFN